jgi:hypothetical protein
MLFLEPTFVKRSTIVPGANLMDHIQEIQNYPPPPPPTPKAGQRPDENSLRLANCANYHEGVRVWLYRPTCTKGKRPSSKPHGRSIQCSHPDKCCGIQDPAKRQTMMLAYLDQLAHNQRTTRDKRL